MNKLFLLLAFAVFALVACSEDKPPPSQSEICSKNPKTKECLLGRWYLQKVEGSQGCKSDGGNLKFEVKKGNLEFSFSDGDVTAEGNHYDNIETSYGTWKLTDTGIEITCTVGFCGKDEPFNVSVEFASNNLRITNNGFPSFLGHCVGAGIDFTEVYTWAGSK